MCLDWPKSPPPTSLTSTTKEAIKNAIIRGELKQVAIYSELALASQWEISKTPIHNALVELSGKGFVTILPRKGFEVGALTTKDVGKLFQFRRTLEITVVDHVTGLLPPQEIQLFEKLVADFENSATIEDFMRIDRAFHERLTQLTDNQFFIDA
jgi:DNA-binding GntR family transcriptional regulator